MNWEAVAFICGFIIQAATLGYFLGAMNQRLCAVEKKLERIEDFIDTKELSNFSIPHEHSRTGDRKKV